MRKFGLCVTAGASFALILALLYRFGLSEEARDQVREAADSVRDACRQVEDVISPSHEEETNPEDLPNRRATAAQWRSLGY